MSRKLVILAAFAVAAVVQVVACGDGEDRNTEEGGTELEDCDVVGDEDGDALADCDDTDCSGTTACNPDAENCTGGADEDGDGDIDCADSDCAATADCACVGAPEASTIACQIHADCRDDACPPGSSVCDFSGASGVPAGHCTTLPVLYSNNDDRTGEPADFGCWATPQTLTPGTTTTVYGCVDSFGLDVSTTIDQQIALWRADAFFAALAATGQPPTPDFGPFASVDTAEVFDLATDCDYDGAYLATGIPVGEKLVVRVFSDADSEFVDTWVFNYAIADDEVKTDIPARVLAVSADGANINVAAISITTFQTIPPLAGLSAGVSSEEGVIAGEVGDCGDRTSANAKISLDPPARKFSYFNGQPDAKPDTKRRTTHVDGLYTGLGLQPGLVTMRATVKTADGELDLGSYKGAVFPESVTILSVRGKQRASDE